MLDVLSVWVNVFPISPHSISFRFIYFLISMCRPFISPLSVFVCFSLLFFLLFFLFSLGIITRTNVNFRGVYPTKKMGVGIEKLIGVWDR